MDAKYLKDLIPREEISDELFNVFITTGYAAEQLIDGVPYVRMTSLYFEDLGDYIVMHPKELCNDYWNRLVVDTKNCSIMTFIKELCRTHLTIKRITNNKVDFLEVINEGI